MHYRFARWLSRGEAAILERHLPRSKALVAAAGRRACPTRVFIRRFLPYFKFLRPVRRPLIAAIVCGLIYGALNGAGLPLMAKAVFPKIFGADAPPLDMATDRRCAVVAGGLPAARHRRLSQHLPYSIQRRTCVGRLAPEYFSKLQQLPLSFFSRKATGDLISRGLYDTSQLQNTLIVMSNVS